MIAKHPMNNLLDDDIDIDNDSGPYYGINDSQEVSRFTSENDRQAMSEDTYGAGADNESMDVLSMSFRSFDNFESRRGSIEVQFGGEDTSRLNAMLKEERDLQKWE